MKVNNLVQVFISIKRINMKYMELSNVQGRVVCIRDAVSTLHITHQLILDVAFTAGCIYNKHLGRCPIQGVLCLP